MVDYWEVNQTDAKKTKNKNIATPRLDRCVGIIFIFRNVSEYQRHILENKKNYTNVLSSVKNVILLIYGFLNLTEEVLEVVGYKL